MTLELGAGPLRVIVAPETGGSIARFDHVGVDGVVTPVLRGALSADAAVLDMGSFPLVPYCNRIRGGRFLFRGREIAQEPNMAGDRSPLHGHGWLSAWQPVKHTENFAELIFEHVPGPWPWAYRARQTFALDDRGLTVELACRNLSTEPMPCGLGHHPYFPCDGTTVLDTGVEDVWTVDADVLPVDRIRADGRYALSGRAICGQDLDNGYSGWSGEALIRTPGGPFAIRITSPNARFFQVYSPPEGGLFVAEPVTHANAALNEPEDQWPGLGLHILEPDEEMLLSARLEVVVAGPA